MIWFLVVVLAYINYSVAQTVPKNEVQYEAQTRVKRQGDDFNGKPIMPSTFDERYQNSFNPAWMDYCDPRHCNQYWKRVCGLNRSNMKFQWFQSQCHIIMNNQCSSYRGHLKYDIVENKFCTAYVMDLRSGCPRSCDDDGTEFTCAINVLSNEAFVFGNSCAVRMANCMGNDAYEEISMLFCENTLRRNREKHKISN